jgi:hypothetical protein
MLGRELDENFNSQVMELFKSLSFSVLQTRLRDLVVPKRFDKQALAD